MDKKHLINTIKLEIFNQHGIKLSDDDPVFSILLSNKFIAQEYAQPIIESIQKIPNEINKTLNNLVLALEDLENTSKKINTDTKYEMSISSKNELESTKKQVSKEIKDSINAAINTSLNNVNTEINTIDKKIVSITSKLARKDTTVMNYILAFLVTITLVGLTIGFMYTRGEINDLRNESKEYLNYIIKYHDATNKLPQKYKTQIDNEVFEKK